MKTKINKVGIEGYYLTTAYWTGENSLYLCAGPQNSMTPFIFPFFWLGGHTSSTFFNSCSIQRYRLLLPVQYKLSLGNILLHATIFLPKKIIPRRSKSIRKESTYLATFIFDILFIFTSQNCNYKNNNDE